MPLKISRILIMDKNLTKLVDAIEALPTQEQALIIDRFLKEVTEAWTEADAKWEELFSSEASQSALAIRAKEIKREIAEGNTTSLYEGLDARRKYIEENS